MWVRSIWLLCKWALCEIEARISSFGGSKLIMSNGAPSFKVWWAALRPSLVFQAYRFSGSAFPSDEWTATSESLVYLGNFPVRVNRLNTKLISSHFNTSLYFPIFLLNFSWFPDWQASRGSWNLKMSHEKWGRCVNFSRNTVGMVS